MEPVTLEADGLRLVAWEQRHMADLARIYADPLIERYLVMPLPWTGPARDRFVSLQTRHWQAGNPRWAIEEDGVLVGSMALTKSFPFESTITYVTAPWARGRGVAQRSIRAAVEFGFEHLGAKRIAWDAIVGNHASRLAALRTGFTVEGLARGGVNQRGAARDCWIGGILPGELLGPDEAPEHYEILKRQAGFFMADPPELDTGAAGLRLRRLRIEDLDDLAATCADAETQRWVGGLPDPYTRSDAAFWFGHSGRRRERGETALYVLADADDRYCGSVELMLGQPGEAELGYFCSPWARGRGWMTAAAKRLCRFGFEELALERIEWRAVVGNEASRRVAEKTGFTVEGVRRRIRHGSDGRLDSWFGSLFPEDLAA